MSTSIFSRLTSIFLFLGLTVAAPLRAETPSEVPNPLQTRRSWVADNADVITDEDERRINAIISPLERRTGAEVAVVTVRNLGGQSVEEFANDLFRRWGVGKKGTDNGVLILAAIEDRKARIEVGYGIEEKITDGQAGEILRTRITSAFRQGAYSRGLYDGALAVAQEIDPSVTAPAAPPQGRTSNQQERSRTAPRNNPSTAPTFPPIGSPSGSSRPPSGGESSGSFIGDILLMLFGLFILACPFLFIGGVIWFIVSLFRRPPRCPRCKTPMQQIPDALEARSLSSVQMFEQQIGSRDYKVWDCPNCHAEIITDHNNLMSAYDNCPQCRNRTARSTVQVIQYPTEWHQGLEQVSVQCDWPSCGHSGAYTRSIPRRPRSHSRATDIATGAVIGGILGGSHGHSHSSSDSGGWGGSSGDSGGSFDSGPSDFGGGDSGGGGASDSW